MNAKTGSLFTTMTQSFGGTVYNGAVGTLYGNPHNLHPEANTWLDRYSDSTTQMPVTSPSVQSRLPIAMPELVSETAIERASGFPAIPLSLGTRAAIVSAALFCTSCDKTNVMSGVATGIVGGLLTYFIIEHIIKPWHKNRSIKRGGVLEGIPQLGAHNVERSNVLKELREKLKAGNVLSIEGIAGSGKTYLAAQLARQLEQVEERPVFWYTFHEGVKPNMSSVLDDLALFLERQSPKSEKGLLTKVQNRERVEEKVSLVADALSLSTSLLFFDNFHHVTEAEETAKIITKLVTEGICDSDVITLVTTTRQHDGAWLDKVNAQWWQGKGVTKEEAKAILESIGVYEKITDEQFRTLYTKTGGSPQSFVLFGEAVQRRNPQEVIDNIPEGDQSEALGYLFSAVYEKLENGEQEFMDYLSIFRRPVTVDAIKSVADATGSRIKYKLFRFRKTILLEERTSGLFELNDALKTLAYNYIDDPKTFHRRAADYYKCNLQGPDDIIEAAHHYFKAEKHDSAVEMIAGATDNLMKKGYLGGVQELLKRFDETIPLTDINRGKIYLERGTLCYFLGEWNRALEFYEKSLKIHKELGDRRGKAKTYNNMGNVHGSQGDRGEALRFFKKGLNIFEKLGDRQGMATIYNNMGEVYGSQGKRDKALRFYNEGLEIFEKLGDRRGMATIYNNKGNVYRSQSKWDKALRFFDDSLEIYKELGDRQGMATIYNNMVNVYRSQMATTYYNMGNVYQFQGEWDKALGFFNDSLEIFEDLGLQSKIETVQAAIDEMLRIKSEGDSHDD